MSTVIVRRTTCARIPTRHGQFQLCHFVDARNGREHLALIHGDVSGQSSILVRVHSECFTGDVLGSQRCDCGEQLQRAMSLVAAEGAGVIIYLRQEGRGIGLEHKLMAYNLQDQGYDTVEANIMLGHQADEREYSAAAAILADLDIRSIRLMTNNPAKIESLQLLGLTIEGRVPLESSVHADNAAYLATKVERMRHMLALSKPEVMTHSSSEHAEYNGQLDRLVTPAVIHPPGVVSQPLKSAKPIPSETSPDSLAPSIIRLQIQRMLARASHHNRTSNRPFVTLTYAQTLDGSIARAGGQPFMISGPESMRMTHMLRASHDAILVGIGTVMADNPQLTVRLVEGSQPQPVILDTHLRTPGNAALFQHPKGVWLATHLNGNGMSAPAYPNSKILDVPTDHSGLLNLPSLLEMLGDMGVRRIMVEGGATVIRKFLAAQLVDQIVLTISPQFTAGRTVFDPQHEPHAGERPVGLPSQSPNGLPVLQDVVYTPAQPDMIIWGTPHWATASDASQHASHHSTIT